MTNLTKSAFDVEKIILQPLAHISQKGPETASFLPKIWRAFNFWYDCPKNIRQKSAEILDDAWSFFCLMDDLIDEAVLRRGFPTAHVIYGVSHTLYGTLYAAMDTVDRLSVFNEDKDTIIDNYIAMGIQSQMSQAWTLHFTNNLICPTHEEYTKYFCYTLWVPFSVQFLQMYGRNKLPMPSLSLEHTIATFAVIYNDYLNLKSKKYAQYKVFCDDLTSGKFSYMVIHAVQSYPGDGRILKLIKERPNDIESKKRFVAILDELGSFEYSKMVLKQMREHISEETVNLYSKQNSKFEKIFDDVLDNVETDNEIYYEMCSTSI